MVCNFYAIYKITWDRGVRKEERLLWEIMQLVVLRNYFWHTHEAWPSTDDNHKKFCSYWCNISLYWLYIYRTRCIVYQQVHSLISKTLFTHINTIYNSDLTQNRRIIPTDKFFYCKTFTNRLIIYCNTCPLRLTVA